MITYFKSISDTSSPFYRDINVALDRIRSGKSKDIVELVRSETNKDMRNEKKKLLPAICFSGTFSKRADNSIVDHSGFICLDFDGFDGNIEDKRLELINDKYVYSVFTSPSGDGLKALVRIPKDPMNHKKYFLSLQKHFFCKEFDVSCKNISRVCYESYDPDIHVNELSLVWYEMEKDPEYKKPIVKTITIVNEDDITKRLSIWWEKNYGMVSGSRNNNLYILASAHNEYGISESLSTLVLMSYDTAGDMAREIPQIVSSAYRNKASFNTKFFEDSEKISTIKNKILNGAPASEVDGSEFVTIDEDEFWTKSSKGKVDLVPHLFRLYLQNNGFYKYYPVGSNNFVFVRVVNNTISDVNEDMIKDFVLEKLLAIDDMSIYNFFAMNTKFFQETFLNYVAKIEPEFMVDTPDEAYLYYQNCAVKVTRDEIFSIDYKKLTGHVWEKQKINRDFSKSSVVDCEFRVFIKNISGDNTERLKSMESTLGYLMHSHKPASYSPAVILNDEVISDNPEGGTGKGIFVKSISHMKKMVIIDGKGFSFQKSFPYQRVQVDTQTLVFDDVARNFDFEKLFSIITEGITLEKKNKDEIHIPFEYSPKIVITTNYAIKGAGNSFERRKWDLEFKQYYTKSFTPESEFGHMLFTGWSDEEWNNFDNYMIQNLQFYLSSGLSRSEFKNLATRKFIAETSGDFWEWCTGTDNYMTRLNAVSLGQELYNDFSMQYPDWGQYGKYKISHNKFYRWIDCYGDFAFGTKPNISRNALGKTIEFILKKDENLLLNF